LSLFCRKKGNQKAPAVPSRYSGSASTCLPQLANAVFEQNGGLLRTSTSRPEERKWHGLVEEAIGS